LKRLPLWEEIELLRSIHPHALITTNYDDFLEKVFDGFEPVVGQKVIRYNLNLIGEIFKIHGSTNDPSSLVLTKSDYDDYRRKKKYISAKLLTYLSEHPVFIFGYGFGDPNVTSIIEDVGEILASEGNLIENIFYVKWENNINDRGSIQEEYLVGGSDGQYRVRAIVTSEFDWIFKSLSQEREFPPINTKLLRALASRTYNLIRTDIPRRMMEVDYKTLEGVVESSEELPKLLGIVEANNSNLSHPMVLTQVGRKLGYPTWHKAHQLIDKIKDDTGINIMDTDNIYHCAVKTGLKSKSVTHKYSNEAVELLKRVRDNQKYKLKL
jgi:rRNA processing protein Gar1